MTATKVDPIAACRDLTHRLGQADTASSELRQQQADLDLHVLRLWEKLLHTDADHPLHPKPGAPHWHVQTSVAERTSCSVPSLFDALWAADLELHFVWQSLEDEAVSQENTRDQIAQCDEESIEAGRKAALHAALTRINQAVRRAALLRTLANAVGKQCDDAQLLSAWARVPATRRSRHHGSLLEQCSDSMLLRRADELVTAINELGERTHRAGFGGVSIIQCRESKCEHPPLVHNGK